VTLRNAPLSGRNDQNIALICVSEKQNIFSDGAGQGEQIKAWGASDLPDEAGQECSR
jgi:hypothetical protein